MEETRRHFLRQALSTTAPICGGILLLNPIDALAAVLRRYHVVAKGDTLSAIAQRYRVSVNQLKLWNGLTKDLIVPGQRIHFRTQYNSLPLTTINKPRINTTKWKNIIAHHSATGNGNAKIFDAAHRRRGMENGLAYHFIICNGTNGSADGKVEVGNRWLRQIKGGHVKSETYNANSIGICVVGNFQEKWVTAKQQQSLVELVDYLKNKTLRGRPKFRVHRELEQTVCPGKNFPVKKLHALFG
jgi:LysM repeat protein